jgi:hypothetical protein
MPFPESVKLEAKQRANFRCVVCHQPWVEVHHIHPEAQGGPDTLDNAAPLCGSCHGQFGGNPDLRKQLREMRDWWWKRCAQTNHATVDAGLAQKIDDLQISMLQGQKRQDEVLASMQSLLMQQLTAVQRQIMTSGTVSGVLEATSGFASGLPRIYEIAENATEHGVVEQVGEVPGAGHYAIIRLPGKSPPQSKI